MHLVFGCRAAAPLAETSVSEPGNSIRFEISQGAERRTGGPRGENFWVSRCEASNDHCTVAVRHVAVRTTKTSRTSRPPVLPVNLEGPWHELADNGYNLTDGHEHGWPCFASNAIADFFLGLP